MNETLEKIPERSAVLIIGSPTSNKKGIIHQIIKKAIKNKDPIVFITTDNFPGDIESSLQKEKIECKKYEALGNFMFIDCYTAQAEDSISDTKIIKRISSPIALNEISVAISEIESHFYKEHKKPRVIFQSLSTLLIHCKPEAIERFVQVIVARTKNVGGTIFFTIEEGMHEQNVIVAFQHLVDSIIELKENKIALKVK